ncbi:MAG TPA: hypothetical protein PKB10_03860, partial [Tepidisphaeraceae bacterium]|nr:hypothetical protein [Tepidisphaeraceae bacterium]
LAMARSATNPADAGQLARAGMIVINRGPGVWKPDVLEQLIRVIERKAMESRDPALIAAASVLANRWRQQLEEEKRVLALFEKFQARHGAKTTHLELGQILCFVFENWEAGLPHLVSSDHSVLSKIARLELTEDPAQQKALELADLWYEAAAHLGGHRHAGLTRAAYWYSAAIEHASGLDRLRCQRRLAEIAHNPRVNAERAETEARVVFVCDGSGTMIGMRYAQLREHLTSALENLDPTTRFNIIFFQDRNVESFGEGNLYVANDVNRRRARDFLDMLSVKGQTDPLPALRAAFKLNPTTIYFVTDGEFDNLVRYETVIAEIDAMNRGRRTTVN